MKHVMLTHGIAQYTHRPRRTCSFRELLPVASSLRMLQLVKQLPDASGDQFLAQADALHLRRSPFPGSEMLRRDLSHAQRFNLQPHQAQLPAVIP